MKILYPYLLLNKFFYSTDSSVLKNLLFPTGILAVTGITFITAYVIYSNYYIVSYKKDDIIQSNITISDDKIQSDIVISDEIRDTAVSHLGSMLRLRNAQISARIRMEASFSVDIERALSIFSELHPKANTRELIKYVLKQKLLSHQHGRDNLNVSGCLDKININDLSPKVLNTINNMNAYLYIGHESREKLHTNSEIKNFLFSHQKELASNKELSKIITSEFINSIHDEFTYRSLIHSADAVNLIMEAGKFFS